MFVELAKAYLSEKKNLFWRKLNLVHFEKSKYVFFKQNSSGQMMLFTDIDVLC